MEIEDTISQMMNSGSVYTCKEIYDNCQFKSDRRICFTALKCGLKYNDLVNPSIETAIDALKFTSTDDLELVFDMFSDDFKRADSVQMYILAMTNNPSKWLDIFPQMSELACEFYLIYDQTRYASFNLTRESKEILIALTRDRNPQFLEDMRETINELNPLDVISWIVRSSFSSYRVRRYPEWLKKNRLVRYIFIVSVAGSERSEIMDILEDAQPFSEEEEFLYKSYLERISQHRSPNSTLTSVSLFVSEDSSSSSDFM